MPSRYIRHSSQPPTDLDNAKEDIRAALVTAVSQCINQNRYSSSTVYVGLAGRALMKYYLSSLPLSHENLRDATFFWDDLRPGGDQDIAVALSSISERSWRVRDVSHISYLETNIGVATLALCRIVDGSLHLLEYWKPCVQLLQSGLDHIHAAARRQPDEDGCELLYGRAGYLYALLQLRKSLSAMRGRGGPDSTLPPHFLNSLEGLAADDSISAVVRDIVRCGEIGARRYAADPAGRMGPPLMWSWHTKRYLGAAHGVAGILQVLWNCPSTVIAPYVPQMLGTVRWLLGCQDSTGNWPTKAPTSSSDSRVGDNELVQWCHGAPGIIILLSTVLRWSHKNPEHTGALDPALYEGIATSLHTGAQLVYRYGLLRKGLGLCHGVAGSVFALLAASDILDTPRGSGTGQSIDDRDPSRSEARQQTPYLGWAVHLAHLATSHVSLVSSGEMSVPDHPLSLYEGQAGMCCAWAQVLCKLSMDNVIPRSGGHGMPGYDDFE